MRYLCLFYAPGAQASTGLDDHEGGDLVRGLGVTLPRDADPPLAGPWNAESGGCGGPLAHPASAATVRLLRGQPVVTTGDMAGTELLANGGDILIGYLVLDVRDLNDAIRIVAAHPATARGKVTVTRVVGGTEHEPPQSGPVRV